MRSLLLCLLVACGGARSEPAPSGARTAAVDSDALCCCTFASADPVGENFSVLDAPKCASTPEGHCVDEGFCPAPGKLDNSKKRR
jgi:hypothetical protein